MRRSRLARSRLRSCLGPCGCGQMRCRNRYWRDSTGARREVPVEELAPLLRERLANEGAVLAEWVTAMDSTAAAGGSRLPAWVRNEMKTVETEIKYSGYLDQQRRSMEKMRRAEKKAIPGWFDYSSVSGLSTEMKQILSRVRPVTLGQASRIAGV